jgi:hypothetical protein
MTTLDSLVLELPESAERVESPDGDWTVERRWLTADALYIALTMIPAAKGPELDPLALDLSVGGTLERYCLRFNGSIQALVAHELDGATEARTARASLTTTNGEPSELLLVAALCEDRQVVTLQVSWPSAASEVLEPRAFDVARTFELGSPGGHCRLG